MNRLELTKTLNYTDFESSVVSYFDQIMGLYNFIHDYDFKSIDGNDDISQFLIKFKNKEDSKKAYDTIPTTVLMYNRTFSIEKSISNKSVSVTMVEV